MMRILASTLALVMLAEAAHGQSMGGNGGAGKQHQQRTDRSDSQMTKADDEAYKAALGMTCADGRYAEIVALSEVRFRG